MPTLTHPVSPPKLTNTRDTCVNIFCGLRFLAIKIVGLNPGEVTRIWVRIDPAAQHPEFLDQMDLEGNFRESLNICKGGANSDEWAGGRSRPKWEMTVSNYEQVSFGSKSFHLQQAQPSNLLFGVDCWSLRFYRCSSFIVVLSRTNGVVIYLVIAPRLIPGPLNIIILNMG